MSERTLFVKLDESEVSQIRELSREYRLPMEEICSRLIIHALSELGAEAKAAEELPVGERQRRAYVEAVKDWEA